jgi:hypothetical protein
MAKKKWRIEGTVDNILYPEEMPIIFQLPAEGNTIDDALDNIDSELHRMAADRGWNRGDYEIHTEETKEDG